MEAPVIGLAPTSPVILVGPVLVIPAYDRIANLPVANQELPVLDLRVVAG